MSSKAPGKDFGEVYEVPSSSGGGDYMELDPAAMTHKETDNNMLSSGMNQKPRPPMQRMDINKPSKVGFSDKSQQAPDASLKKMHCFLIFMNVVYSVLLLICIIIFGVMGVFRGEGKVGEPGPRGPAGPPGPSGIPSLQEPGTGSSIYIRWGRTECNSTASLVYAGVAGGKHYNHAGSGINYLCMPEDPEYDVYVETIGTFRAFVYSTEYLVNEDIPAFAGKNNHDVPCAVCDTTNRGRVLMIPAKMTCPSGWTKEYNGYLMTERHHDQHRGKEFVCVDRIAEILPGTASDLNGALLTLVEGRCDAASLPCAPYINGAELSCVVCSK